LSPKLHWGRRKWGAATGSGRLLASVEDSDRGRLLARQL
jgi:hypothetical protein